MMLYLVVSGSINTTRASSFSSASSKSTGQVPDKNGVMMYDYGGKPGKVYNPVILAAAGENYYQKYQNDSDKKAKEYFINTADWLVKKAKDKGNYSLWIYHFPSPYYEGLTPPYSSALAQSGGIKVLILAHNLTGDQKYLLAAQKAFGAFLIDYDKGGVITTEKDNSIFLQELAKRDYPKTYILNGHIFSLISLWIYYQYTRDPNAAIIFNKGVKYLEDNLWKYDTGKWSYYDLIGHLATIGYQKIHIEQLAKLYNITGNPILKKYSDRFAQYLGYVQQIEGPDLADLNIPLSVMPNIYASNNSINGSNRILFFVGDRAHR